MKIAFIKTIIRRMLVQSHLFSKKTINCSRKHWIKGFSIRDKILAPIINDFIKTKRPKNIIIIHPRSDTEKYYIKYSASLNACK